MNGILAVTLQTMTFHGPLWNQNRSRAGIDAM